MEVMYPPEKICQYLYYTDVVIVDGKIKASLEQNSWNLFQTKAPKFNELKPGVAFDHRYITPDLVTDAIGDLAALAGRNIRSYGLLNIVRKPTELHQVVQSMKPVVDALKDFQGNLPDTMTIIAIGSYDYSPVGFMDEYKNIVEEVVNTFKADAVIAISSVGSMEDDDNCYAAPPNVLSSNLTRFPSLESHWHFLKAGTTYSNARTIVGLSFEMATLMYVLKKDVTSVANAIYERCTGIAVTSRDAVCGQRRTLDMTAQYIDIPYMIFGTFVRNSSRRNVAFAEYFTSAREKFFQARKNFGRIRRRAAFVLFNVHLTDVRKKCGGDAFKLMKWALPGVQGRAQNAYKSSLRRTAFVVTTCASPSPRKTLIAELERPSKYSQPWPPTLNFLLPFGLQPMRVPSSLALVPEAQTRDPRSLVDDRRLPALQLVPGAPTMAPGDDTTDAPTTPSRGKPTIISPTPFPVPSRPVTAGPTQATLRPTPATRRPSPTTVRPPATTPPVVTTPWPEAKEMVCTVGHTAVVEAMYPPEKICQYLYYTDVVVVDGKIEASLEQNSWKLFQTKAPKFNELKPGVAFDHRYITPDLVTDVIVDLVALAEGNIRSYGLLNIIRKPTELHQVMRSMKPVVDALKDFQGNFPDTMTIIAIGSYDYSPAGFMDEYKNIVEEVVNTFKADVVIAISSVGSMEDDDNCYAAPPNVLSSNLTRFPSLESHWHFLKASTTYSNARTIVGLSYEMATLMYVLKKDVTSVANAIYERCTGIALTSRDAVCGQRTTLDMEAQYIDKPYMIFGTFVRNSSRRNVAFSEYFLSAREKFDQARRNFGRIRRRAAFVLFNVHLVDVRKKCGEDAFSSAVHSTLGSDGQSYRLIFFGALQSRPVRVQVRPPENCLCRDNLCFSFASQDSHRPTGASV
ncbi:hypothetical protein MTO96_001569 [Rhipicephalus appendiculatus]